jgi:hypothetical protein
VRLWEGVGAELVMKMSRVRFSHPAHEHTLVKPIIRPSKGAQRYNEYD